MISSAVVIPESPRDTSPPSKPVKRRLSQSPSRESKRPRVEVDELQYDEPQSRPAPPSEPVRSSVHVSNNVPSTTSPPRRKSSLLTGTSATEEKKRSKRLFGSVLGTLSQTTTKPAHKKRDEIEARQRERMRQQTEEEEERRIQRKKDLERRKRDEQKLWDEEAMRQRHRNMRDMAGFLRTRTEPRLYYKPWEFRPEEEEEIERQKEDVERAVRRELGQDQEVEDSSVIPGEPQADNTPKHQDSTDGPLKNGQRLEQDGYAGHDASVNGREHDDHAMVTDNQPEPATNHDQDTKDEEMTTTQNDPQDKTQPAQDEEDPQKEEDHHGEELVEGQEDDVIY